MAGSVQGNSELGAAFGDLDLRADVADRISLKDYVTEVEIGAFQQERGLTQRLRFAIVVELAARVAAGDDVDLILSYDRLSEAVDTELAAGRLDLLETLAERVAARILREPQAARVFVRIEKLDRGPWVLGVELARRRGEVAPPPGAPAPRPLIALLNGPMAGLAAPLARLKALGQPLVILACPADMTGPPAADAGAQFRIGLLAIEQAAWVLAAGDGDLKVVATRTEIDWALRRGHAILWAPGKLAIDSPDAPRRIGDGMALAGWLAGQFDAREILVHGTVAAGAESRVPVRAL